MKFINLIKTILEPENLGPQIKEGIAILPGVFDPCFKKVFIESRPFLIKILHKAVGLPMSLLEENLQIKNSEYTKDRLYEKKGQSDIVVEVLNRSIILEMNTSYARGEVEKSISYFSRKLLSGIKEGTEYKGERVNILIDFVLEEPSYFKKTKDAILKFGILEEKHHFPLTENVKFFVINLAKIYEKWYTRCELDEFEKMLLFLVMTNKEELESLVRGDKTMEDAKEKLESINSEELFTEYEREALDRYAMNVNLEHAKKEGIKVGEKRGIEIGQREANIKTAKNLLQQGILPIQNIAEALNLSIHELEELKKELSSD